MGLKRFTSWYGKMSVIHHYASNVCRLKLIVESIQYIHWVYSAFVIIIWKYSYWGYFLFKFFTTYFFYYWVIGFCEFGFRSVGVFFGSSVFAGLHQALDCNIVLFAVELLPAMVFFTDHRVLHLIRMIYGPYSKSSVRHDWWLTWYDVSSGWVTANSFNHPDDKAKLKP